MKGGFPGEVSVPVSQSRLLVKQRKRIKHVKDVRRHLGEARACGRMVLASHRVTNTRSWCRQHPHVRCQLCLVPAVAAG